jgi:regulatory protein
VFGRRLAQGEKPKVSCRDSALASLGRRGLTRRELRTRLLRKGYGVEEVDGVLLALEGRGLVDDGRTADEHVRSRASRGVGKRRVAAELVARGVPEEERERVLSGIDPEAERGRLDVALAKRDRTLPPGLTGRERSRKLADHLVRRGFSLDAVLEALRRKGEPVDADE